MSLLSKKVLLEAVKGEELFTNLQLNKHFSFSMVTTDSRKVQSGCMFVPLIGEFQDGHTYVESACNSGSSVVLVCKSSLTEYSDLYKKLISAGVYIIGVDDTLHALQSAAAAYVRQFPNLIKIGITGSSGKTTTKELVSSVLSQQYSVIATEGNLNSETGLPLSVFNIKKQHEIGVFEMGMNRVGEISELADVLFPNAGIITNIGTSHIGILGTKDAIAQEKKKIFKNFSQDCAAFIPCNDSYANYLAKDVPGKIVFYGINSTQKISHITKQGLKGTSFCLDDIKVHFPLPGLYNFHDACAAISVGQYFGLTAQQIVRGLEQIKPLFGRSQIIDGYVTVIQDCYNANQESMLNSIELCDESSCTNKKIYILGDMLELGENSFQLHTQVCKRVLKSTANVVILVGKEMCKAYKTVSEKSDVPVYCIPDFSDNAIKNVKDYLSDILDENDFFLLKGSRGMRIERFTNIIASICQEQGGVLNV